MPRCHNPDATYQGLKIDGHRTSARLEPEFWAALLDIAKAEGTTPHHIASEVARHYKARSLSSAIRIFVMDYYRAKLRVNGVELGTPLKGGFVPVVIAAARPKR